MKKWEKRLKQPEKFISISYQKIDFLIPNEYVISSVGVKDVQVNFMQQENSGIFDFDEIAIGFSQYPRPTHVKTLIVLKDENDNKISIVTTQECKVCTLDLERFSLFANPYFEKFKSFGFMACLFEEGRMRILIDVQKTIDYMSFGELEEL